MTDYHASRYYYRPRRRKWKLATTLLIVLVLGGAAAFSFLFLDARSLYGRTVDLYRVTFNDYRFLEKNLLSGNYNSVIRDGTPYLEKSPYNSRLIRYLGEAYYYVSNGLSGGERDEAIDKAIRYMRKGIVLASFRELLPRSYYILGMSYFRKGAYYYELAAEYLKKALDAGHRDPEAYEILGYCFFRLGIYDEAIVYLEKAKSQSPKEVVRLYLAHSYKGKGDFGAAKVELAALEASSKDYAILEEVYSLTAWVRFQEGDYAGARGYLAKVLELNRNSAEAHFWLGNIFEKEGDAISARKEWRMALKIDPKHIGAIEKLY